MEIPTNLRHKPVIVADNYESVDGRQAGRSEVKGLSLGLAQWNDRGNVEISAKVWRRTGDRWSRQSEELPLHRVLDLALLVARARQYLTAEAYRQPEPYDPAHPLLDRIPLQGGAMNVSVCTENPMLETDFALLRDGFAKDDELISERLRALGRLLSEMGYTP